MPVKKITFGNVRREGKLQATINRIMNFLKSQEGVRGLIICASKAYQKHAVESVCNDLRKMGIDYSYYYGVTEKDKNSIIVKVGETEAVFSIMGEQKGHNTDMTFKNLCRFMDGPD